MISDLISTIYASEDSLVDIGSEATKNNFFGYTCIAHLVSNLVSVGLTLSGVIVFIYLVWGGIDYLTSGGEKGRIENSQKRITSALIGLAIVASSWAIYQLVLFFFGINLDNICSDNPFGN